MKKKYCIMLIITIILSNMRVLATAREQVKLDFVIPQYVEPPTSYEEVTKRILAWQEIIPDGTIWNEHTPYGDEGYLGEYYEWTTWKGNPFQTTACSAFSYVVSNGTFGSKAPVYLNTNVKFEDIRPGDVLTLNKNKHCVIVVKVNKEYDNITIAEGNVNGRVKWNGVMSKQYIMERINYLETRYPEGFVDGPTVSTSAAPSASVAPLPTPSVSAIPLPTPSVSTTPSPKPYKYANKQRVEKPYTYLYDSNNDKVDTFRVKGSNLTYKGKKLSFKSIRWSDFNQIGNIIVTQKNSVYYSVSYVDGIIKVKKLGKGAVRREKKNGLVINIITNHGKKNVAKK